jgi:hypothetical protein
MLQKCVLLGSKHPVDGTFSLLGKTRNSNILQLSCKSAVDEGIAAPKADSEIFPESLFWLFLCIFPCTQIIPLPGILSQLLDKYCSTQKFS